MENISDVFEAFGGPAQFARSLGIKGSTASEMKRRASIPVEYWPSLVKAGQAAGLVIDNDTLVKVHVGEQV
ncbi:MAG: hypothetical protein COB78_09995 [Hyphomicrobiales bacterium]|nr:MAG: hypothetical protein COB78_09995 [Hyphomicrobiales bacterium]